MKLYRTVSADEFENYQKYKVFKVARNTIEGKQFFKTEAGVNEFVKDAEKQDYFPPYKYILIVQSDLDCLEQIPYDEQELDRFEAITVHEDHLGSFNDCIKFVEHYEFKNYL